MASIVSICNMALSSLGVDRINSLDEDTTQARTCNAIYEILRDEELESHPWNFATKRTSLAQLDSTPSFGYSYAFALPDDYMRIISVQYDYEYRIENGELLSDQSTMYIEYIARVTDTTLFSSAFISALSSRMAMELAYPLTNSATLSERMEKRYLFKKKNAIAVDSQEGTPRSIFSDSWINARYSGTVSNRYDYNYDV